MIQYFKSRPENPDSIYMKYDINESYEGSVSTVAIRSSGTGSAGGNQITFNVLSGSVNSQPPVGPALNGKIAGIQDPIFLTLFTTSSQEEYDTFINSTFELYKTY